MSQASLHIDSFDHTKRRYASTAIVSVDPLLPARHQTHVAAIYPLKRQISAEGTPTLGETVDFKFPTSGYVHHIAIKVNYGTTVTADVSAYIGMSAIEEVEFRSDNETLMKYKYHPVILYYLSKLENEEALDKILLASGGSAPDTTAAAVDTIVPIPLFFDSTMIKGVAPLNLSKFKKQPHLSVTFKAAANVILSGGSGADIVNAQMVLYMSETASVLKNLHNKDDYFYKSIDFYTNTGNTVATATDTDLDISGLKGQIKRVMLSLRLSSDVASTANVFFALKQFDYIKTNFDGHEDWVFRTTQESEFDYIMYNHGKGFSSTLGYPVFIPYSFHPEANYALNNVGGIHSSKVNKHILTLNHSLGANGSVDVLGIRSAIFKYDNGTMIRLL